LEASIATQSWVNREYRSGLRMHPYGAPVLRISGVDDVFYPHHLGAAVRKSRIQGLEINDEFGEYCGVKC
jgi:hypothetical protein